jgi:hypothetical protein
MAATASARDYEISRSSERALRIADMLRCPRGPTGPLRRYRHSGAGWGRPGPLLGIDGKEAEVACPRRRRRREEPDFAACLGGRRGERRLGLLDTPSDLVERPDWPSSSGTVSPVVHEAPAGAGVHASRSEPVARHEALVCFSRPHIGR